MEETFAIYYVKFSTSYEIALTVIKKFVTKSDIKGYHVYPNNWKQIIRKNVPTRPESANIIDQYVVAVLKDAWVFAH